MECAATLYSCVVLHCDGFIDRRSFEDYKGAKDVQRLAEAMAVPAEERDPDRNYYRRSKPQLTVPVPGPPTQAAGDATPNAASSSSAAPPPETKGASSGEESDSDDSTSTTSSAEEEERKAEEREHQLTLEDHDTYTKMGRFLAITRQLPLEIQMVVCNYACNVNRTIIRSSLAEHAFRHVISLYE